MAKLYIQSLASDLIKKYKTRNPFEICSDMGIEVKGEDLGSLKGMYIYYKKRRIAYINNNLDEHMKLIVLAHELGHDMLHREYAKNKFLQEFMLYDMNQRPEYEANVFASELLLSDEDIVEYAKEGYDIEQISRLLNSDINLVAIKLSSMNLRGFNFGNLPYASDFLGK